MKILGILFCDYKPTSVF